VLALAVVRSALMLIALWMYTLPSYTTATGLLPSLRTRMVAIVFFAVLASLLWYGYYLYRKSTQMSSEIRVALALLPVTAFSLALRLVGSLLILPWVDWNALRLVPTFQLARHAGLYTGISDGPILGFIYGPMTAIAYLPTVLASTPTAAVFIGGLLTVLISLAPLILFLLPVTGRNERDKISPAAAILFAIGALLYIPGTFAAVTSVHADAPAVGWGLLSLAILIHGRGSDSGTRLGLSALFAVLAVWTKQIEAPLLAGIAFYLWLAHGRKTFAHFVAWAASIGIAASCIFCAAFGLQKLVFNMWTIPARHPWQGSPQSHEFLLGLGRFFSEGSFLFVLVLSEMVHRWGAAGMGSSMQAESWQESLRKHDWTLPLLVALFMVPTSVIGASKIGGTDNSYHAYFYLAAACAMIFRDWLSTYTAENHDFSRVGASVLLLALAFFAVRNLAEVYTAYPSSPSGYTFIWNNPQQQAFTYDRQYPGEVYFPWNPLSTFMANGKLYHFAYGIFDRQLAGFPAGDAQLHSYLPPRMKYLAYYNDSRHTSHLPKVCCDYLRDYSQRVDLPELPGWVIYKRP
jgi:hypothetical protein